MLAGTAASDLVDLVFWPLRTAAAVKCWRGHWPWQHANCQPRTAGRFVLLHMRDRGRTNQPPCSLAAPQATFFSARSSDLQQQDLKVGLKVGGGLRELLGCATRLPGTHASPACHAGQLRWPTQAGNKAHYALQLASPHHAPCLPGSCRRSPCWCRARTARPAAEKVAWRSPPAHVTPAPPPMYPQPAARAGQALLPLAPLLHLETHPGAECARSPVVLLTQHTDPRARALPSKPPTTNLSYIAHA